MISFAIITNGKSNDHLNKTVDSIIDLKLEFCEILIVGLSEFPNPRVRCVPFDESVREAWITRKKNLAVSQSTGDIVVILHDYMQVNQDWTNSNVQSFINSTWDVAMCRITNPDGSRWVDWTLWARNSIGIRWWFNRSLANLVPYKLKNLTRFMYVGGAVMIVRKEFMLKNPLDENLAWGESEDVEWSLRVRKFWNYKMFSDMSITSQKQKHKHFRQMGFFSRVLMRSYSTVVEIALPKSLSRSLEIGFVEMLSGHSESKQLAERLTSLKKKQTKF